jgi:hypothetical protein
MTGYVTYGSSCIYPVQTTPENPPALSGFADITVPGKLQTQFKVRAYASLDSIQVSQCATAAFLSTAANVSVQVSSAPYAVDLYGTGDGIPVRLRLWNSGCLGTTGSLWLTDLRLNGAPPRLPNHASALPSLLVYGQLGAGLSAGIGGFAFSSAEVGHASGEVVQVTGTITYGYPTRTIRFGSKIVLP